MSNEWLDFLLAAAHHVLVFGLFAILAIELVLVKPGLDAATVRRLGRVDMLYGMAATLVIVVGFLRAIYGLKGWEYYSANILFWVKVGLFIAVGLLSAPPTIAFLRWNGKLKTNAADLPSPPEVKGMRKWIHMEFGLLILIPIVAAALARGMMD